MRLADCVAEICSQSTSFGDRNSVSTCHDERMRPSDNSSLVTPDGFILNNEMGTLEHFKI